MTNKKISELDLALTTSLSDEYAVNQAGTTKKITKSQVLGAHQPTKLLDSTLSDSVPNFNFGVSSAYDYIDIRLFARTDRAVAWDFAKVSFNSDTTDANYRQALHWSGTAHNNQAQDSREIGVLPGASASSNMFGILEARIWTPQASQYKALSARSVSYQTLGSAFYHYLAGLIWESTSQITSVTLTPPLGANFVSGSRCLAIGYITP